MNRKTRRLRSGQALRALAAVPGLYPLLAFLAARRVVVRGRSMSPTLMPGERVLFDRVAYRRRPPRPDDIVLACHPARPGVRMIKRVAGVPGDSVSFREEPRVLGVDDYWLLGDSADLSTDSRHLGPVRHRDILARGWIVYWPPERVRRLR